MRRVLPRAAVAPPRLDLGVVARQEHLGDLHPAELPGPRVVRMVEQVRSQNESCSCDSSLADHPGHQPRDRLDHHERRHLATGQHVVADREFLGRESLHDALVDAFVAPAEEHEVRLGGEFAHERLVEPASRRRQEDRRGRGRGRATRPPRTPARPSSPCRARRRTACRRPAVRVGRERPQIVDPDLHAAWRSPCPAGSARAASRACRGRS